MKKFIIIIFSVVLLISVGSTTEIQVKKVYNNLYPLKLNKKWGFINSKGEWIIKPKYDNVSDNMFSVNGLAKVKKDNKWGFINSKGEWIIKPDNFNYIGNFNKSGLAIYEHNKKYGLINKNGKILINPLYQDLRLDEQNNIKAKINNKWGCKNLEENWVLKPKYDWVVQCSPNNSSFIVQNNEKYGLVDKNGKWIKKPIFKEIDGFYSNGLAIVKINNRFGVINKIGRWILEPKFSKIIFINDLILVHFGDYIGYTLLNGKYLTFTDNDLHNYLIDSKLYLNDQLAISEGSIVLLPLSKYLKKCIGKNKDYIKINIERCSAKKRYCYGGDKNHIIDFDLLTLPTKKPNKKDIKNLDVTLYVNGENKSCKYDYYASYAPLISIKNKTLKKLNLPHSIVGKWFRLYEGKAVMPMDIFIDTEEQTVYNFLEKSKIR